MIVKVSLFAGAKEIAGVSWVELTLESEATVSDLKRKLAELYPDMEPILDKSAISVGQEYSTDARTLYEGAEVGLIPPVSGG